MIGALCFSCGLLGQSDAGALPEGWDALLNRGGVLSRFCPDCVARGEMEMERVRLALPRRTDLGWDGGIAATLRPAHREVLIAVQDGRSPKFCALGEDEAAALHAALGRALACRGLAQEIAGKKADQQAGPHDQSAAE